MHDGEARELGINQEYVRLPAYVADRVLSFFLDAIREISDQGLSLAQRLALESEPRKYRRKMIELLDGFIATSRARLPLDLFPSEVPAPELSGPFQVRNSSEFDGDAALSSSNSNGRSHQSSSSRDFAPLFVENSPPREWMALGSSLSKLLSVFQDVVHDLKTIPARTSQSQYLSLYAESSERLRNVVDQYTHAENCFLDALWDESPDLSVDGMGSQTHDREGE